MFTEFRKSKALVLLLKASELVLLVNPVFHMFLAFLLLPPYTGYLFCRVLEWLENNDYCQYQSFHFWIWIVRLLSGMFATIAMVVAIYPPIVIDLVEILMALFSFREYLAWLEKRVLGLGSKEGKDFRRVWQFLELSQIRRTFREVQITVIHFNGIYEDWYFFYGLAVGDLIMILSGYCALKLWKKISFFGAACFVNITIISFFIAGYLLSTAAKVWVKSDNILRNMKRKTSVGKCRYLRRQLAACGAMKIKIGCVNFVDRATAGVFLLYTAEQIGSLALM
jgi:hypothetical protein